MTVSNEEPVEISTRMRPGEWTEQSLAELSGSYQDKVREMGATEAEIKTHVDRREDGSVSVRVSWERGEAYFPDSTNADNTISDSQNSEQLDSGQQNPDGQPFGRQSPNEPAEASDARSTGETIPQGQPSKDSQGLGAVLGDADRSAIDEPPAT